MSIANSSMNKKFNFPVWSFASLVAGSLFAAGMGLAALSPSVFAQDEVKQLSLTDGDAVLMTYNAAYVPSPDPAAPWFGRSGFIHPVYTPKGKIVTDGFPSDHMHHHGLMFAWTSAVFEGRDVDFWNSKKRQGRVEHVETLHADADKICVRLQHVIEREDKPLAVLQETWELNRVPHESIHVFDLVSIQTCATDRGLEIQKYHYGAMCIRGPLNWDSGDIILTSEGKKQPDGNHTRPNWVAMSGEVDGELCGIAAMSHPDNFRAPQPVRIHPQKPYFCFAPMVLGEFRLEPDKPYVSRFRFVAFDGEPDPEQLDLLWEAFANGKK
ncbi:MAG: PmoA family protein [Akkermansiaceae bacterium]